LSGPETTGAETTGAESVATPTGRPTRADAQRNRERLLEVARAAFAEAGADGGAVSLEAIARAAGVGIGTLYRHFPTREVLAEAVYRVELGELADAAGPLLDAHPGDVALDRWTARFDDYVRTKRGMADAIRAVHAAGGISLPAARETLGAAVQRILDAGAADGTLRSDARAEDVVLALVGIAGATPEPAQRDQARRMTALLLDGLRRERMGP
jgi:AcrR family transcriptional regulator